MKKIFIRTLFIAALVMSAMSCDSDDDGEEIKGADADFVVNFDLDAESNLKIPTWDGRFIRKAGK